MTIRRRDVVRGAALSTVSLLASNVKAQVRERKPQLDPKLVQQFVSRSHGDLETVRALAKQEPTLVRASWDQGGGDWETGLGAASHMGRRDIAQFLIDEGARINVFTVFMLGDLGAATNLLKAFPEIHRTPGPHGIPLLSHAIVGKRKAFDAFLLLLDSGVDIDQAAWRGTTPLMQAVLAAQPDMVRALLERGANAAAAMPNGVTALDMARRKELSEIAQMLERV